MPSHNDPRSSAPRLGRWLGLLPVWPQRRREAPSAGKVPQLVHEADPPEPVPPPAPVPATILVTVLGLSGRALEEVLELASREAETKLIVPVFITDVFDFAPFRRRRLRFEYFPGRDRQQRFAPELEWDLYLRRRYALLSAKWQAKSVISFGRPPPRDCVVDGRLAQEHS